MHPQSHTGVQSCHLSIVCSVTVLPGSTRSTFACFFRAAHSAGTKGPVPPQEDVMGEYPFQCNIAGHFAIDGSSNCTTASCPAQQAMSKPVAPWSSFKTGSAPRASSCLTKRGRPRQQANINSVRRWKKRSLWLTSKLALLRCAGQSLECNFSQSFHTILSKASVSALHLAVYAVKNARFRLTLERVDRPRSRAGSCRPCLCARARHKHDRAWSKYQPRQTEDATTNAVGGSRPRMMARMSSGSEPRLNAIVLSITTGNKDQLEDAPRALHFLCLAPNDQRPTTNDPPSRPCLPLLWPHLPLLATPLR